MRIPLINGSIRNAFSHTGFRWTLERLLLLGSDYRVANSHAGLQSRGFSAADARSAVIYNGFDFSRVDLISGDRSHSEQAGDRKKIVGMVAEFNPYKDYSTLILAAQTICARRKDVEFVMVGDGETLAASQRLAAGFEAIHFVGRTTDVEAVVETFNVGALCTFVEGFSNSIMEYMALGKPVVATDGGGTRELVIDGVTGFLVPASDPAALAAKIEYLLDNPTIARRMGSAGETRLRREFALGRMVEETERLYERAIARGATARDDPHASSVES
jgi:glycosyltransferase involved in cell wall biosynthesis